METIRALVFSTYETAPRLSRYIKCICQTNTRLRIRPHLDLLSSMFKPCPPAPLHPPSLQHVYGIAEFNNRNSHTVDFLSPAMNHIPLSYGGTWTISYGLHAGYMARFLQGLSNYFFYPTLCLYLFIYKTFDGHC